MKKKFFVVFFLLLYNFTNAQICKSIDCNGVKNYLIGKIIFESIKGKTISSELQSILDSNSLEKPADYLTLSVLLDKNDFKETRKKLGDKISEVQPPEVDKSKFASAFLDLIQSKLNHKQDSALNFTSLKPQLLSELNLYFDNTVKENPETSKKDITQVANSVSTSNKEEVKTSKTPSSFFSFLNLNIFIVIAILLSIVLFFLLNRKISEIKKIYKNSQQQSETLSKDQSSTNANSPKMNIPEFEKMLGYSPTMESFQKAIVGLQNDLSILNNSNTTGDKSFIREIKSDNIDNIFYMKYPVENAFYNNHKSAKKENTIYKFIIKPNKIEAEFEVHADGVKLDEILSMVERTIKSACNEENIPTSNTKYIKTTQKGLAQLENDKWIIKSKAVIKYE